LLNASFSKQPRSYYELNLLGIDGWRRLSLEFGGELQVDWSGTVEWRVPGVEAEELRHSVAKHQEWGYSTRLIEEAGVRRMLPNVNPGVIGAASFSDQEGAVDPVHAVKVLLKRAEQAGARVEFPCAVTGIRLDGGNRVKGVETTKGDLVADFLVAAAGVDTPRLCRMVDVDVPLKESPGVLAHTVPQPRLLDPVALGPRVTMKQKRDGRIVTGTDFGGTPSANQNKAFGQELLRNAQKYVARLKTAELEKVTLGYRVMPTDEFPIVGFTERCPNLYVTAMHSGMTLSPLIGQLAATEILDGTRVGLLQPYRLSRFR